MIGLIERDNEYSGDTLYCTILFFGLDGKLLGKHRKLKPTGSQRLIWGEEDGSTLPVFDTPFGKIGALICWENYIPLARAVMYAKGVQNLYCTYGGCERDVAVPSGISPWRDAALSCQATSMSLKIYIRLIWPVMRNLSPLQKKCVSAAAPLSVRLANT